MTDLFRDNLGKALNKPKLESSLSLNSALHSRKNQCQPMIKHFVIAWKTESGARSDNSGQVCHPDKCPEGLLKVVCVWGGGLW